MNPPLITIGTPFLLTPIGVQWTVPAQGGESNYGFTVEAVDTQVYGTEYYCCRRKFTFDWVPFSRGALVSWDLRLALLEGASYSDNWSHYALLPVALRGQGRRVVINSFTF